ncbi:nuclear rna binding [Pyrenophora seminiperda CCB06]|uniref:Nuclear rna binding n=1 Tax=Pyrenophora seminiperda CCB06 TaxID=1302712 RepID=A0A3M7LXS4_9PLEO|nr:nuclear rna binding [Pyrenophora seminiperda CCB06]
MPITRATTLAMSEDTEDTAVPRISRFREHTNTTSSIHAPPEELWKDVGIEDLIDQFNEENARPAPLRKTSAQQAARYSRSQTGSRSPSGTSTPKRFGTHLITGTATPATAAAMATIPTEGTYARLRSALTTMFGGVLGKRKAGQADAEREKDLHQQLLDERKTAAEAAYHEAKNLGLLPTPKVYIRPAMAARQQQQHQQKYGTPAHPLPAVKMQLRLTAAVAEAATPNRTPRTPGLYRTPSKKDLQKQKKLSKRVSDLEFKLASARKELQTVLYKDMSPRPNINQPKLIAAPPTPDVSQSEPEDAASPTPTNDDNTRMSSVEPAGGPCSSTIGKITKKRKATTHDSDAEYKPVPTDSEADVDLVSGGGGGLTSASENEASTTPARSIKRLKNSASRRNLKRHSSRIQSKFSRSSMRGHSEEPIRVVPDGVGVPEVPSIPVEMEGKGQRVVVRDDGFGGFADEIF